MPPTRQPTQYQRRLFDQIQKINNEILREMICESLYIEYRNRSALNFPIRQIKDLVDARASLIEKESEQ